MKVLFLSNNKISEELANWLETNAKENVIRYDKRLSLDYLKINHFDFFISYNYKYIIKKELIDFMENKIINLHISYLPWNKGAHPNMWSFVENTPKGITIHIIDEGLDTGPILVQKKVNINETIGTLRSSYEKLHKEIQELFKQNWNKIKTGKIKPIPQKTKGTLHYKADFKKIEYLLGDQGWDSPILEIKKLLKNSR